jgi:hypothetical protein
MESDKAQIRYRFMKPEEETIAVDLAMEQTINGIRFTPMERVLLGNHSPSQA